MPSRHAAAIVILAIVQAATTSTAHAAESYRFTDRAPQVGDQATQGIDFDMKLSMTVHQAGQVIESVDRDMQRKQRRRVTVLEIDGRLVTRAKVYYETSEQMVAEADKPPVSARHPVVGKTYLVSRPGGEHAELIVTDDQGRVPPPEELAIVQGSMVAIGRPNPWIRFLSGRTLTRGETVRMPNHLAADLLGMGGAVDEVTRFEITLSEVRQVRGTTCAVLQTQIEATSPLGNSVNMLIGGHFLVEMETCRTLAAELTGDVAISEVYGPAGGQFTVDGKGNMRVAIEAEYGPAPQRAARR